MQKGARERSHTRMVSLSDMEQMKINAYASKNEMSHSNNTPYDINFHRIYYLFMIK